MKTKKNLIKALKKLVTSFGGEAKSNNAVDLVDEFADVAAQGSGNGSNVLRVTFDFNRETDEPYCSHTFQQIKAVYDNDGIVYGGPRGNESAIGEFLEGFEGIKSRFSFVKQNIAISSDRTIIQVGYNKYMIDIDNTVEVIDM